MKSTPIIMTGDHPAKIIAGIKTVTRRTAGLKMINQSPDLWALIERPDDCPLNKWLFVQRQTMNKYYIKCPYGTAGDQLWVRECWASNSLTNKPIYKSDYDNSFNTPLNGWKPSIHMFKKDSRITLTISDIRPERLQDITEEECAG